MGGFGLELCCDFSSSLRGAAHFLLHIFEAHVSVCIGASLGWDWQLHVSCQCGNAWLRRRENGQQPLVEFWAPGAGRPSTRPRRAPVQPREPTRLRAVP